MKVTLISKTEICNSDLISKLKNSNIESLIQFCARVSSPNQTSGNPKLIKYCLDKKHWSVFEQADLTIEVETSRAISAQILRHKSFSFQEFSQRYQQVTEFETYEARQQDIKNRQNSTDDSPKETQDWFQFMQTIIQDKCAEAYKTALEKNIAKEQARMLLPMSTKTKLYMKGNLRSWITYLLVRLDKSTQKEHRDIALEIQKIFVTEFPIISAALNWSNL